MTWPGAKSDKETASAQIIYNFLATYPRLSRRYTPPESKGIPTLTAALDPSCSQAIFPRVNVSPKCVDYIHILVHAPARARAKALIFIEARTCTRTHLHCIS